MSRFLIRVLPCIAMLFAAGCSSYDEKFAHASRSDVKHLLYEGAYSGRWTSASHPGGGGNLRCILTQVATHDLQADFHATWHGFSSGHSVVLHTTPASRKKSGGSALASDRMHHEIVQLAREKPVVACMANVAASGGYYVAAPAHKIVCEAVTITGSIGVVGARLTMEPLMAKLGITTETVQRGARAGDPRRHDLRRGAGIRRSDRCPPAARRYGRGIFQGGHGAAGRHAVKGTDR